MNIFGLIKAGRESLPKNALPALMESLGGSLERIDWDVQNCAAYAVADLPDSVTAAVVLTATARTGAFISVEAHELLSQEQMHHVPMIGDQVCDADLLCPERLPALRKEAALIGILQTHLQPVSCLK